MLIQIKRTYADKNFAIVDTIRLFNNRKILFLIIIIVERIFKSDIEDSQKPKGSSSHLKLGCSTSSVWSYLFIFHNNHIYHLYLQHILKIYPIDLELSIHLYYFYCECFKVFVFNRICYFSCNGPRLHCILCY